MTRLSLREPIDQMCKWCSYDETEKGTWREQVENCCSKNCPLFPVRPRLKKITLKDVFSKSKPSTYGYPLVSKDIPQKKGVTPSFSSKGSIFYRESHCG